MRLRIRLGDDHAGTDDGIWLFPVGARLETLAVELERLVGSSHVEMVSLDERKTEDAGQLGAES